MFRLWRGVSCCRTGLGYTNASLEYFHRIQVLIVVTEIKLLFPQS